MNRKPRGTSAAGAGTAGQDGSPGNLADRLRERTRALHAQAERSGIVQDIVRGRVGRNGYALLLRNLLPAYRAMEQGLDRHRNAPGVRWVARPELFRARAIERDLEALSGPAWNGILDLLPAGERYGRRAETAATGDGTGLIAHAYARYLGDLNGGRVLKRLLAQSPGLGHDMLGFYDFPAIADLDMFKRDYRAAFDRAGLEIDRIDDVLDEAAMAFQLNIEISEAVQRAVAGPDAAAPAARGGAKPSRDTSGTA